MVTPDGARRLQSLKIIHLSLRPDMALHADIERPGPM
jgi:hypothetical protein